MSRTVKTRDRYYPRAMTENPVEGGYRVTWADGDEVWHTATFKKKWQAFAFFKITLTLERIFYRLGI